MKKVILSSTIIGVFLLYAFINSRLTTSITSSTDTVQKATPTTASTDQVATEPTVTSSPNSKYKDGEYTGTASDAFYGNIQVKATISGGQITDIVFLQSPHDQQESVEINSRAMPILKQEAISAQSANVEIVSRATDSSNAFIESLSSALQQAQS